MHVIKSFKVQTPTRLSSKLFEKRDSGWWVGVWVCVFANHLSDIFRPFFIISGTDTLDYDFNFLTSLAFLGGIFRVVYNTRIIDI
jgi:hypothetical protein